MINGGGYLRLTPSVPLLVLLVPVSTGGGYQYFPVHMLMFLQQPKKLRFPEMFILGSRLVCSDRL